MMSYFFSSGPSKSPPTSQKVPSVVYWSQMTETLVGFKGVLLLCRLLDQQKWFDLKQPDI